MATQFSFNEALSTPESEYHAEELKKRLQFSMANFAQIRFKRSMQMRMVLIDELDK